MTTKKGHRLLVKPDPPVPAESTAVITIKSFEGPDGPRVEMNVEFDPQPDAHTLDPEQLTPAQFMGAIGMDYLGRFMGGITKPQVEPDLIKLN